MALEWLIILVMLAVTSIVAGYAMYSIMMRSSYRAAVLSDRHTFRHAQDGNEYRSVIFKAYRRMEANLNRYGVIRHESETVRQYLARVPEHLAIDTKALKGVLDTFEQARYSDHPCGEPERGRAINALRAVQYSLEKIILTQQQLAGLVKLAETGGDPIEPKPATLQEMGLWVVAPFVPGSANIPGARNEKYRDLVPPRDSGREELLKKYGPSNVTNDTGLPKEEVESLAGLAAGKLYTGLGTRLLELAGGPANGWRVRVEPSLASYLLEFVARCADTGRLGRPPSLDDSKVILLAATVLAVADGRDYLIPDDLKLALVGAGPFVYHVDMRDVVFVLDDEIRHVPFPSGMGFMKLEPVKVRGLSVPRN